MSVGPPLEILLADDDLVAVDKPAGMLCDATIDPDREHLGTELVRWAKEAGEVGPRFHPAHRLDRGTSGVVVFARTREAATALMLQFQDRSTTKHYQALVMMPPSGEWAVGATFERRTYLRHRDGRSVEVRSGGKPAESRFEVVAIDGSVALVDAHPRTGRTHQLRVHLAALGAPVIGDELYGTGAAGDRLWLHARSLAFTHPGTGEPCVIRSHHQLALSDAVRHPRPTV